MSSFQNQPRMDDIITAFKTTQNHSWSVFNNTLGGILIHDDKKRDVFKSKNPIKLTNEDIPVFGIVPRLEKLTLVSCNKCSMIVKRDCMHYHYNRRHKNSDDDNFSLEHFILPTKNISKHRKQKMSTLRKLPEKKTIDGEDIDPSVQQIDTEFEQFDFERSTEINQENIEENEMQYDDENESEVNLAIESCNTNTSCSIFDWNLPPFTQNLMHFGDHKISDGTAVFDDNCNKLSSDDGEQDGSTFLDAINDENIFYGANSSKLLTKSLDSNKKPNVVVDFSSVISENHVVLDEDPNDEYYHFPFRFVNYKEQIKFSTDDMDSDVTSNNNTLSDDISSNDQSSNSPICVKEKSTPTPNNYSESEDDERLTNVTTNIDQLKAIPVEDKEETLFTPSKHINVINNENSINTIDVHQCQVVNNDPQNDNSEVLSNEEQTKCTPSNFDDFDKTNNTSSSNCTMNFHQTSSMSSIITKEYQPLNESLKIIKFQPLPTILDNKEEHQSPHKSLDSIEEHQPPHISLDSKEEYQPPHHNPLDNKEEYQLPQSSLSIEEEINATTNTKCVDDFLCNETDDSSEMVSCQLPPGSLINKEPITAILSSEYLDATSNSNSSSSITSHEQLNCASLKEYQSSTELSHIKEKVQIISNIEHSNLDCEEKEKHESNEINDVCKVTPPKVLCSETKTNFPSIDTSVELANKNCSNDEFANISSSSPLSVLEETHFSQSNNCTVNRNNESTDDYVTSDDQSESTLPDSNESKSSLTTNSTNYSNNSGSNDCTSDDSINEYYQSAIGYHDNAALIPLLQSLKYLDTSSDEVYESADESSEEYINHSYLLPPIVFNNYDETSSTSSDVYSSDANNITSDDSTTSYDKLYPLLSIREESKDVLMDDILDNTMDNNYHIENIEKYYLSSTESLDSEIQSFKCSNSVNSNSSNSLSAISFDESSISSSDSKVESQSDSSFDESSDDSVSSSDQSTASSNCIVKKTKSTQTNIFSSLIKHQKCVIPNIETSIAESLSAINDLNKIAQTNESLACKDCRRVSADLVEYYYPSSTRIEVDAKIFFKDFYYNVSNSVNGSIPVSENTQDTGNSVDSFTSISSNAQTEININTPVGDDQFNLNSSADYHRHINNCLLRFRQFSWNPNKPVKQNSVIENDYQVEDNDSISDFDLYADRQNDVSYSSLVNGSTVFINKNHVLCYDRLKRNSDKKMVYVEGCNYVTNNSHIETIVKKNLKRRLGQIADDKENQEKNNRLIFGGFKKLKRHEFMNRKISCSDESDNNVDE